MSEIIIGRLAEIVVSRYNSSANYVNLVNACVFFRNGCPATAARGCPSKSRRFYG
jgi:hypothetical protein